MLGLSLAGSLSAATITKANNTNDLSLGSSWTGGVAPGSGDVAQFDTSIIGTGNNSYDFTSNLTWQQIRVDRSTATAGGTETIGSSNGSTLTLTAFRALADIGTANNFTGQSSILMSSSAGASLVLNCNIILAPASNSASLITSSRALTINGNIEQGANTLDFNIAGSTTTISGAINGSGTITKVGGGTLTLSGAGTLGSTTGALTVNGGTLDLGGKAITKGAVTFGGGTVSNGTLTGSSFTATAAATISANLDGNGSLTKSGSGNLVLSGNNNTFTGQMTVTGGYLVFDSINAENGLAALALNGGNLALGTSFVGQVATIGSLSGNNVNSVINPNFGDAGVRTLSVNQTVDGTYLGKIEVGSSSRDMALIKEGSASLTLSGTNTYSGGTTVIAGTLKAGSASAFGNKNVASSVVTVNGGTLDLNGQGIGNKIVLAGGSLINTSAYTGTLAGTSGSFDSGTSSTKSYTVDVAGLTLTTLSGQGTFSGGLVTVTNTHNVGNSPGQQSFTGDGLSYANGSTLNLEFDNLIASTGVAGTNWDVINVTNTLTIGTGVTLNWTAFNDVNAVNYADAAWDTTFTKTLITAGTITGSFVLPSEVVIAGQGAWTLAQSGNTVTATWTAQAIPEPSSLGLLGVGMAGMLLRRRRKQA